MLVSLSKTVVSSYCVCYTGSMHKEESQDTVIPDTMPDVGSVVGTNGGALIRSKDVSSGRCRIEAAVPARVIYTPEDGGSPCCLDVTLPFFFSFEDDGISEQSFCTAELCLLSLETRLLNPRKLSVRAELLTRVICYSRCESAYPGAPEAADHVNTKETALVISPVCALEEKTFVVTDEFRFPEGTGRVEELLARDTALRTEELRSAGNKLILKGSADTRILYLTESGEIAALSFSTDFSQIMTPEELPEDALADASLLLSGAYVELEEDGTGGTVELHLVAQLRVHSRRELSCITDAYSNRYALEPTVERRDLSRAERVVTLRESMRMGISTGQSVSEVLQSWLSIGEARSEPDGLTVPVTAVLYYLSSEGMLCAARHTDQIKLIYSMKPGQRLELLSVCAPELTAAATADGAELRGELEARALLLTDVSEEIVTEIGYDETAPLDLSMRPAVVLLRTDSGADLWELARQYCSTVPAIRAANSLDSLPAPWEKLLLIPKSV